MSSSLINQVSKPEDDPDWQSQKHTPAARAKHMLELGLFSDVEFTVGDEHQILKAHKSFLAMTSPVFETMFFGNVPQPQPVAIPDIEPSIFSDLLQYIYTDIVNFESVDHADGLSYAADKYMLPILSNRCIQYVKDNLSPKNVFRALEFGVDHHDEALKEKCFSMLGKRVRESYRAAGFEEINESTLLTIIQMDALDINEFDLFKAVQDWATRQCANKMLSVTGPNMRKELNKVIGHIRFLAMTPEEFATGPATSGILTNDECLAVFMNLNSRVQTQLPPPLSNERKTRGPRAESLKRNRGYAYESWYY